MPDYKVKKYGIDISEHQPDPFPFGNYQNYFVILRIGYSKVGDGNRFVQSTDSQFADYLSQVRAAGNPIGVYWYTVARNVTNARSDARALWNRLNSFGLTPSDLPYGVWFDVEDSWIPGSAYQAVTDAWYDELVNVKGWTGQVGMYYNASSYTSYINRLPGDSLLWIADWGPNDGQLYKTSVPDVYIQQFTSVYQNFQPGGLDADVLYGAIPSGGGGGLASNFTQATSSPQETSRIDAIAWDVVLGKYGNGRTRKKKLGSQYKAVQARVDHCWTLALKVIRGDYGNGETRKKKLGKDYWLTQHIVDHILK